MIDLLLWIIPAVIAFVGLVSFMVNACDVPTSSKMRLIYTSWSRIREQATFGQLLIAFLCSLIPFLNVVISIFALAYLAVDVCSGVMNSSIMNARPMRKREKKIKPDTGAE